MSSAAERVATPMPNRLRTRPRDPRGFPIPFIVYVDADGTAQFSINDARKVSQCRTKHLCGLCGKRFDVFGMWFVGGPSCFLHPQGAFIDPPMHHACAAYALAVCPFLAAPSYAKRIDFARLGTVHDNALLIADERVPTAQPECFGLGGTTSYRCESDGAGGFVFVIDKWLHIEWWKDGVEVDAPESGTIE